MQYITGSERIFNYKIIIAVFKWPNGLNSKQNSRKILHFKQIKNTRLPLIVPSVLQATLGSPCVGQEKYNKPAPQLAGFMLGSSKQGFWPSFR